jgi:hypothetical protein
MRGHYRLRFFRAEHTEFAAAETDLRTRGLHMDVFLRACLRRLHRDPEGFLALLDQARSDSTPGQGPAPKRSEGFLFPSSRPLRVSSRFGNNSSSTGC